jgi:hypothetical protein
MIAPEPASLMVHAETRVGRILHDLDTEMKSSQFRDRILDVADASLSEEWCATPGTFRTPFGC